MIVWKISPRNTTTFTNIKIEKNKKASQISKRYDQQSFFSINSSIRRLSLKREFGLNDQLNRKVHFKIFKSSKISKSLSLSLKHSITLTFSSHSALSTFNKKIKFTRLNKHIINDAAQFYYTKKIKTNEPDMKMLLTILNQITPFSDDMQHALTNYFSINLQDAGNFKMHLKNRSVFIEYESTNIFNRQLVTLENNFPLQSVLRRR